MLTETQRKALATLENIEDAINACLKIPAGVEADVVLDWDRLDTMLRTFLRSAGLDVPDKGGEEWTP